MVILLRKTSHNSAPPSFYCCGKNDSGSLGLGHSNEVTTFTLNEGLAALGDVAQVVSTGSATVVRLTNGDVYGAGYSNYLGGAGGGNSFSQLTSLSNVAKVFAAGSSGFFYIMENGDLYATGSFLKYSGNPGSESTSYSVAPGKISAVSNVVDGFSINGDVTIIKDSNGDFYAWGYTTSSGKGGVLGPGGYLYSVTKSAELSQKDVKIIEGSSESDGSFCLLNNGTILMAGGGSYFSDSSHSCYESADSFFSSKTVRCVGGVDRYMQYGVMYVLSNGDVYCRGSNRQYQLGLGNTTSLSAYTKHTFLSSKNVVGIDFSYMTGLARCSNGDLYSWGYNQDGEAGQGSTSEITTPTLVDDIPPVKKILCASYKNSFILA